LQVGMPRGRADCSFRRMSTHFDPVDAENQKRWHPPSAPPASMGFGSRRSVRPLNWIGIRRKIGLRRGFAECRASSRVFGLDGELRPACLPWVDGISEPRLVMSGAARHWTSPRLHACLPPIEKLRDATLRCISGNRRRRPEVRIAPVGERRSALKEIAAGVGGRAVAGGRDPVVQ
jgi:hypothetical protein